MSAQPFRLEETTIDDIRSAFKAGEMTCRRLVELYLARIEAYDKNGPELNSVIMINPRALEEAEELDRSFEQTGDFVGPLHGIPVLLKDQAETRDMPTTFGSIALKDYFPEDDATVVKKLRETGAVILAKTNLPDFATSWFGYSSAGGETKNPYALDRDPGGSSAGTGAAVAANLGAVGIGEDTGGSIRLPASFDNLVGLRVTTGLISRAGMSPLVKFQDTAGPMTRAVKDAAILLDVLVGYDPADPFTASVLNARVAGSYADHLTEDGLRGARIGILREAFGPDDEPDPGQVNEAVEGAIEAMKGAGAELVDPVSVPDLQRHIEDTSLYLLQSKHDITEFLSARPNAPARSFDEIYDSNQYHPNLDLFEDIAGGPDDPEGDPGYFKGIAARGEFQRAVLNVMALHGLDALLYPCVRVLPPTREELRAGKWTVLTFPTNTLIGAQADLPSVSLPAGFAGEGVPVGLEILGKPYDEPTLLKLAYSYEQVARRRRPPESAPPLPDEPR